MSSTENPMMASSDSEEEDKHRDHAMQLASASVLPMVLKAAIDMGLLEIIEKAGPGASLSSSHIASQLSTQNPEAPFVLDRVLALLASHSILTCSTVTHHDEHGHHLQRLYALSPVSKYFLPNQDGVSLAPTLSILQDKVMIDMWYHLKDAVLEGGLPFNRAYGMSGSEYASKDANFGGLFGASMVDFNSMLMEKILEKYKGFEGLKSIVDVGGGNGSILNTIVTKYPTIQGINFDLATVVEKSAPYPGIKHVAGDMFVSIPKGDAIFMKWILHSWDDQHCLKLLRNCYQALPDSGKVIVVDMVVPEAPESSVAVRSMLQFDLITMSMNPGGKERTEKQFEALAREAGFCGIRVACRSTYNFSLVEFYKKT